MGKPLAKRKVYEWVVTNEDGEVCGFDKEETEEALQFYFDAVKAADEDDEEPYIYLRVSFQETYCQPFTGHIRGLGDFEEYRTWETYDEEEINPFSENLPRGIKGLWNRALKKVSR